MGLMGILRRRARVPGGRAGPGIDMAGASPLWR